MESNKVEYMQWIPRGKRYPSAYKEVLASLVRRDGKEKVKVVYTDIYGSWHRVGEAWEVVAWMPLPEPFKK